MFEGRGWSFNLLLLLLGIYLFVCSLCGLKASWIIAFAAEGKEGLAKDYVSRVVGNPLSALCAGIMATAIVQSSSGVVAVCIATVAAGGMTVAQAVPFVMGANIGTTITSVLIALGYSFRKLEFSRAVPVALANDVFKVLNVSVFFILESTTHLLSRSSTFLAGLIGNFPVIGAVLGGFPDFIDVFTDPAVQPAVETITVIFGKTLLAAAITGIASFIVLLLSLEFMSTSVQNFMKDMAADSVDRAFKTPFRGIVVGSSVTWVLQSSSVATALAIPFVASGAVSLKKIYPYLLGCNIGTTIDPGQIISYIKFGVLGLSVGLVHVIINVIGVTLWLITPGLRDLPLLLTSRVSNVIVSSRNGAVSLVMFALIMFFIIPGLVIYLGG
ncbi:MAG: Na/Pi symporter [Candidatus Altiarchaeota archaeon]